MDELERLEQGNNTETTLSGLSLSSIVLLIGILMVIAVFALQLSQQNRIQPLAGEVAPDFEMTTFEGEPLRLSDLRGQIVIVNFWGSWCAPCRAEAPDLQAIYEDYRDQGVIVVGVNWLDPRTNALAFIDEFGLTYPNAPDIGEIVGGDYRIQGAPENFIVGRDGVVIEPLIGAVDYTILARILDEVLASESSS